MSKNDFRFFFSDFDFKSFKKAVTVMGRNKVSTTLVFETRTPFQTKALNTLKRHPTNSRGIATAVYGANNPRNVARAGSLLRRLRDNGYVKRDKAGVWLLI